MIKTYHAIYLTIVCMIFETTNMIKQNPSCTVFCSIEIHLAHFYLILVSNFPINMQFHTLILIV